MTSRGPAASMSGTSNPRVRWSADGTPSSSSSPWMNSASAWFCAPATRTSPPSAYCGLILRARSCLSVIGSLTPSVPADTSGMLHSLQKRASSAWGSAQLGHTSGCELTPSCHFQRGLGDHAVLDPVVAHDRLGVLRDPDDEPFDPRPQRGEVH